jgi:hypothetical protein
VIRTALAPDPGKRFASCAAMIEALERACELEGWDASIGAIRELMASLFGAQQPMVEPVVKAEPTVVITRPRRFPRGTESDMWDDDAPTRGRRSMPRMWSPLAA